MNGIRANKESQAGCNYFFHSLELENDFEKEKRTLKLAEIKKSDSMQYWGISWVARLLKTCKWNILIQNMQKISLRSIANMISIKETVTYSEEEAAESKWREVLI